MPSGRKEVNMNDSFIAKLVSESKLCNAHEIATYVWNVIQSKRETMSNLDIMKEIVSSLT